MNIGLDYDDTYTSDPEMWDQVIERFAASGHVVYLVTCRVDDSHNRECCRVPGISPWRHIFTSHSAKCWFMEQRGIKIDVWIDDNPETIIRGM